VNLRDHHGRTPLHLAAAFNQRAACETLLFLGANPLIEDSYGQRPLQLTLDDSIRLLLTNKMTRSQQPQRLYQIERLKARPGAVIGKEEKKVVESVKKHITPGERDIMKTNPKAVLGGTMSS
jgi:hypothetical protein